MLHNLQFDDFLEECGLTRDDMDNAREFIPPPKEETGVAYEVRPSSIEGMGVFATKDIEGVVGKFKADEWYVLGRYANHSATPNTTCFLHNSDLVLKGKVAKDEEITVDYFQVRELCQLQSKVITVDDFCDEVETVIASVRAAGFSTWLPNKGEVGSSVYEGMGFWGQHALMLKNIMLHMGSVIVPNSMFFRCTNEGMEKAYIHSDRESGGWTCVAYLSDHEEESGTAFFRHKPTGLTAMPSFAEMKEMGIFDMLKEDMVSRDESKWEQVGYVEGKKNRAVLFHAPLFHSRFPLEGLGKDTDEGRLVWVSHFYKLNGFGQLH